MRKGSLNVDFLLAFALFIIAYGQIFSIFFFFTTGIHDTRDELLMESRYLSSVIVNYAGYPKNWSTFSAAQSIGFAYYNYTTYANILDKRKILAITSQNCNALKSKSDITMNFKIIFGTNTSNYSCIGTYPPYARQIERVVYIYDGQNYSSGKVELYTWL